MRLPFSEFRLPFLQEIIHRFEEGGGTRYLRWVIGALLLFILVAVYNVRAFRNFSAQEAMDSAQLARNICEGKGYSTSFIRPFSVYLVKKRNAEHERNSSDPAQIKGPHPDIANPPVYPVLLAGLMKVLPFKYTSESTAGFWSRASQPDFLISLFSQFLFLLVVLLVFKLAKRLFDAQVAWVSALALLGTELLWRFSVSGLSTMLLMLILVGLAWALVLREEWGRDETCGTGRLVAMGAAIGVLAGVGALTRYSFAFIILPVVLFLVLFSGRARPQTVLCAILAFGLVLVPWLMRNYYVSGHAFGIASFALLTNTSDPLSGNQLERSLQPQLLVPFLMRNLLFKLTSNIQPLLKDLPTLGGTWISAFFLVGLMIGYRRESPRRLRYFLLSCIPVFVLVQALGRTYLSDDSAGLNTENLLVLLTPFVIVFGVSLFFLLLDQIQVPALELRYIIIGLFLAVASLPLLLVFSSPTAERIALPYFPKFIQFASSEVEEKELTMSDIPWAMAWYGRRDCMWLTLNPYPSSNESNREDLLAVNYYLKPVAQLYLSPITIDRKPLNGYSGWTEFVLAILVNRELPPPDKRFTLTTSLQSMDMIRRGHLVLMPWDRRLRNAVRQ